MRRIIVSNMVVCCSYDGGCANTRARVYPLGSLCARIDPNSIHRNGEPRRIPGSVPRIQTARARESFAAKKAANDRLVDRSRSLRVIARCEIPMVSFTISKAASPRRPHVAKMRPGVASNAAINKRAFCAQCAINAIDK